MTRKKTTAPDVGRHQAAAALIETNVCGGLISAFDSIKNQDQDNSARPTVSDFASWHPVLRPMRRTIETWLDSGEPKAFSILSALAITNGLESFWSKEAGA